MPPCSSNPPARPNAAIDCLGSPTATISADPLLGNEFAETPVGLADLGASLDRLAAGQVERKILINPGT